MGLGYRNTITLALAAASANNICLSQTRGSAGALTLNGATAANGVAVLDVARRVLITAAANESGITFTITGTDRGGRAQTEVVTGPNTTSAFTVRDFLTITGIAVSGAMTGNVTIGTNVVGSTAPIILDTIANPFNVGICALINSGTPSYTAEVALVDNGPEWNISTTPPTWFPIPGFTVQNVSQLGSIPTPVTMVRLTNNLSIGSVTLTIIQCLGAGGA